MKRLLLSSLLTVIFMFSVHIHPAAVHAASPWIMTERVWDDERLQPNETFTWSGGHDRDGYAAGQGVLQWYVDGKPGNRYEGNMAKGKINGKGICTYANGNRYEGEWSDGRRTGNGCFTWANGNRYEGDFIKDQRTGKGIMAYANGDRYEGDWVDGWRTGKGIMAYANGNWYEGDWVSDAKAGKGTMIFTNGRRQEGKWISDGFAGPGQSPVNYFLIFGVVAGTAAWMIRSATRDGQLAWRVLLKKTGIYSLLTLISAIIVKLDGVGWFLFDWTFDGIGLNNTAVVFLTIGAVAAAAVGYAGAGRFSWRRSATYFSMYAIFTLILYAIWYVYAIIYAIFIFSLGGR